MPAFKRGLTLIETIVAIAIFTIGMEGFTLLFIRSWQSNAFILEAGQASMMASRGTQATVDTIRNARQADNGSFAIVSADDNDFIIYSNVDTDSATERVHYYLQSGTLKKGVTNPNAVIPVTYPAGDQSVSVVAGSVANSINPVFTYFDINNDEITTPAPVNAVKMVKVHLEVNINPNHAPDSVNIQSYATIRNLSEYDRAN